MSSNNVHIYLSSIPGFKSLMNKLNEDGDDSHEDDVDDANILKLNKVICKTDNNQKYKVIRYDKHFLSYDNIPTYGLFRSVILTENNDVVCFSPPKSLHSDTFLKLYNSENKNIIAEEFVEGTMINAFWDNKIGLAGGWEISTRNSVGAATKFYKNMTFRDMFLEAAQYNNFKLELLNNAYCYSFVLQHPENRIVVPFNYPKLYLIAVYSINNTDKNNIFVTLKDMTEIKSNQYFASTTIQFPETYSYTNYSELIEKYASMNTPYDRLGFVLYNKETGERTKVRNPVYEQVRQLRGNQPKLQYQYLSLRNTNRVAEYLKFYPECKKDFSEFRDQLHLFTLTLFNNYISCYIKKEKKLLEFSQQYRTHMFNLHKKFINELKEKKLYVTKMVVIQYVNNINPSLLMYCLNFHLRKRNVDFINADDT